MKRHQQHKARPLSNSSSNSSGDSGAHHRRALELLDALQHDVNFARTLLKNNRYDGKWREATTHNSLLHITAYLNLPQAIKLLLSRGDDAREMTNKNKETALHLAAANNCVAACRVLLECGADANARDNTGSTPLMRATACGNLEAVSLLLSCRVVTAELQSVEPEVDYDDQTVLQIAQATYSERSTDAVTLATLVLLQRDRDSIFSNGVAILPTSSASIPRQLMETKPVPTTATAPCSPVSPTGSSLEVQAQSAPPPEPSSAHASTPLPSPAPAPLPEATVAISAPVSPVCPPGPRTHLQKAAKTGATSGTLDSVKFTPIRSTRLKKGQSPAVASKLMGIYSPAPLAALPFLPSSLTSRTLDVILCVEHCFGCASHQSVRHDYDRYRAVADRLLVSIVKQVCDSGLPIRLFALKSKPTNAGRIGGLEATVAVKVPSVIGADANGWLSYQSFSKLNNGSWPPISKVARETAEFVTRAVSALQGRYPILPQTVFPSPSVVTDADADAKYRDVWRWMARLGSMSQVNNDSLTVSVAAEKATEDFLSAGLKRAHAYEVARIPNSPPAALASMALRQEALSQAERDAGERIRAAGSFFVPLNAHHTASLPKKGALDCSHAALERLTLQHFLVFDRTSKLPDMSPAHLSLRPLNEYEHLEESASTIFEALVYTP